MVAVDAWISRQPAPMSQVEAVRRLVAAAVNDIENGRAITDSKNPPMISDIENARQPAAERIETPEKLTFEPTTWRSHDRAPGARADIDEIGLAANDDLDFVLVDLDLSQQVD